MRSALIIGIGAAPPLLSTVVGSQTPPVEFDFKAAERRLESNDDFGGNKDTNPLFAAGAVIAKIRDIRTCRRREPGPKKAGAAPPPKVCADISYFPYQDRCSRFLSRVVATGSSGFAIKEADVRNASTVTLIALRRVFVVRQRA
jgi:hypothetical protein